MGATVRQPIVVVVAVPTHDDRGRLSGVLVGSIQLKIVAESKQALALGYGGLQVVDRDGQLLFSGLAHAKNPRLLARIARGSSGVVPSTPGLNGRGDDAVAYSLATVPGWVVTLVRSRSTTGVVLRRRGGR